MGKISAGSYDLNTFLHGGYETDIVTVFYGGAGTGKTNLCLLTAVSQAKKGNKVIFVDSEGGFSVERVKQLAGEDYEKVFKKKNYSYSSFTAGSDVAANSSVRIFIFL